MKFVKMLEERDIWDVDMLNEQGAVSVNTIRKLPTYHVIILPEMRQDVLICIN